MLVVDVVETKAVARMLVPTVNSLESRQYVGPSFVEVFVVVLPFVFLAVYSSKLPKVRLVAALVRLRLYN